jgi:C1A family cysteine protease
MRATLRHHRCERTRSRHVQSRNQWHAEAITRSMRYSSLPPWLGFGLCVGIAACDRPMPGPSFANERGGEPDRIAPVTEAADPTEATVLPAPGVVVVDNAEYWARVQAGETAYDLQETNHARLVRASETQAVINAAAARPDTSGLIVMEIPDSPTEVVTDEDGEEHRVTLSERDERNEALREALEADPKALEIDYAVIYDAASSSLKQRLIAPKDVSAYTEELVERAAALVAEEASNVKAVSDPPSTYPTTWEDEEGTADLLGDHSRRLARCGGARSPRGIYANFDWPLKWMTTSVKAQGQRGTCGAFALTSAAEQQYARLTGTFANLSEQDLYFHIKGPWSLGFADDDGTRERRSARVMKALGYNFAFESDWDYNPSIFRRENPLSKSCVGYKGEMCSDTWHQGKENCSLLQFWKCFAPTGPKISGRTSLHVEKVDSIARKSIGKKAMIAALASGRSIVFSFDVTAESRKPGPAGYMAYKKKSKVLGGHLVHMVAYVSNADLAARIPSAPPGEGGGYFVIKNSYGECWGDGGYFYMPAASVQEYGNNAAILKMAL